MSRDTKRVIVEMPEDLKEVFQRQCAEDLTDMSTKGRQLIFDYCYAKDMAPRGFHGTGAEQSVASASHRKRAADDGRAGGATKGRVS